MNWTPEEAAKLLANRVNQHKYLEAVFSKVVDARDELWGEILTMSRAENRALRECIEHQRKIDETQRHNIEKLREANDLQAQISEELRAQIALLRKHIEILKQTNPTPSVKAVLNA